MAPLPPNPPELPRLTLELPDVTELPDDRLELVIDPELRAAGDDDLLETDATLLPADEELTCPASEAALFVAALTRALLSAAAFAVAAVPPPVPEACPDTALRAYWSTVLREVVWAGACDVDGPVLGGT